MAVANTKLKIIRKDLSSLLHSISTFKFFLMNLILRKVFYCNENHLICKVKANDVSVLINGII